MKTLSDLANDRRVASHEGIEEARTALLSLVDKAKAALVEGKQRETLVHRLEVLASAMKYTGWQSTISRQDTIGPYKEALYVLRAYPGLIEYYARREAL